MTTFTMKSLRSRLSLALLVAAAFVAQPGAARVPDPGETLRVSLGHQSQQSAKSTNPRHDGFGASDPDVSDDGRFVAFASVSDNLVPGDSNGTWDVFLRDMMLETTTLISATPSGTSGNETSRWPSISADGTRIVFTSRASDLVPGDIDGDENDIYLKDMTTGSLTRISVRPDGSEELEETNGGTISPDGRYAAFWARESIINPRAWWYPVQIVVRDLSTGAMEFASLNNAGKLGDQGSWEPKFSRDGRYVAFTSWARNLGPVPPHPGCSSCHSAVYVRDRALGKTIPVSLSPEGEPFSHDSYDPSISDDGRWVAFTGTNLVRRPVAWPSVYVRDLVTGEIERESDGLVGEGLEDGYSPAISGDGRFLVFGSGRFTHVGDTNPYWSDIFMRDRVTGTLQVVSVDSSGRQGPFSHSRAAISSDGRYLVWESLSPTMVSGDTNFLQDIFMRNLAPPAP